jgi:hypothetical protein
MHKYAIATALAISLITMLALTVSASLTPANAGYCDNKVCLCQSKCRPTAIQPWSYPVTPWFGRPLSTDWRACIAKCGPMEGVEHLSPSALRAR